MTTKPRLGSALLLCLSVMACGGAQASGPHETAAARRIHGVPGASPHHRAVRPYPPSRIGPPREGRVDLIPAYLPRPPELPMYNQPPARFP